MTTPSPLIEWAAAGRPISGEVVSGDRAVVRLFAGGALLGVVDGLGHGLPASQAADAAVELIGAGAGEPLDAIILRCQAELRSTRGVVVSLAAVDAGGTLRFSGIGSANGLLFRPGPGGVESQELVARGGVVGRQMPTPRVSTFSVRSGDVLVLPTDGIRQHFAAALDLAGSPEQMAAAVCARYARDTDDALVLVARFLGARPSSGGAAAGSRAAP